MTANSSYSAAAIRKKTKSDVDVAMLYALQQSAAQGQADAVAQQQSPAELLQQEIEGHHKICASLQSLINNMPPDCPPEYKAMMYKQLQQMFEKAAAVVAQL